MIGAFFTFLVLFGLIKTFERKRDDLENFNIATVEYSTNNGTLLSRGLWDKRLKNTFPVDFQEFVDKHIHD